MKHFADLEKYEKYKNKTDGIKGGEQQSRFKVNVKKESVTIPKNYHLNDSIKTFSKFSKEHAGDEKPNYRESKQNSSRVPPVKCRNVLEHESGKYLSHDTSSDDDLIRERKYNESRTRHKSEKKKSVKISSSENGGQRRYYYERKHKKRETSDVSENDSAQKKYRYKGEKISEENSRNRNSNLSSSTDDERKKETNEENFRKKYKKGGCNRTNSWEEREKRKTNRKL